MNSKIKKYNKVSDELGKLGILNLKRKLNKSEIEEYCECDGLTKMAFEIVLRDTNKKLDVIDKKFINIELLKYILEAYKIESITFNDKPDKMSLNTARRHVRYFKKSILKLLEDYKNGN